MAVLVNSKTRLICQGITGGSGSLHSRLCMEYGTNLVAGVTPGKGGQTFNDSVPIFNTVKEAKDATDANATMIFYIKLVQFSIIFYGLVYALPLASSCCDSDAKSSTLQFQVGCLTLFQRRPVKARWRGCRRHLDT